MHVTTQKRPCDLLVEEGLRPLPNRPAFLQFMGEDRKVSKDGFSSFGGSWYGVPWAFASRTVEVRENGGVPLGSDEGAKRALATRVSSVGVKVRSLKAYEAIAEVAEG